MRITNTALRVQDGRLVIEPDAVVTVVDNDGVSLELFSDEGLTESLGTEVAVRPDTGGYDFYVADRISYVVTVTEGGQSVSESVIGVDDALLDFLDSESTFDSRADFEAATIVAPAMVTSFLSNGVRRVLVRDAAGTAVTSNGGTVNWSPASDPHLHHFTDNATPGTTNVTEPVRRLLAFSALKNRTARFDGVGIALIDTDAAITINSSVDFSGMFVRGNEAATIASPTSSDVVNMFVVEDSTTPLTTATITTSDTLTQSKFAIGSTDFATDFLTEAGYARIALNNGFAVPNRDRDDFATATDQWDQSTWCTREGVSVHPLAVDLSATTSVTYSYRKVSQRGWVYLTGLVMDMDSFNHCQVITVKRNCVSITGTTAIPTGSAPSDTCNRLVYIEDAGQIVIDGLTATAQDDGGNGTGTYLFRVRGGSEIKLNNISGSNGWGATAMDQANGVYISNSEINRFDTHGLSGNMCASNVKFTEFGVAYGAGFGTLTSSNCSGVNCPAIYARGDYGGYWHGDIIVENYRLQGNSARQVIVDHETDPLGVTGFSLPVCHSLSIDGVTVSESNDNNGTTLVPWALDIAAISSGAMYAPNKASIRNVYGYEARMEMPIDYADLQRSDSIVTPLLEISRIHGTRSGAALDDGLYFAANSVTGGGNFPLSIAIDNCSDFFVNLGAYTGATIRTHANSFTGLRTTDAVISNSDTFLDAYLDGAEVASPAGGAGSEFLDPYAHDNWDFSGASVIRGMRYLNADAPTLPAEVTKLMAFNGYWSGEVEREEWFFNDIADDTAVYAVMPYYSGSGNHFYTLDLMGNRPNANGRLSFRGGSDEVYNDELDGAFTLHPTREALTGTTGNDTDLTLSVVTVSGEIRLYIENRKGSDENVRVRLLNHVS